MRGPGRCPCSNTSLRPTTVWRSDPLALSYHRWSVVAFHAVVAAADVPPPTCRHCRHCCDAIPPRPPPFPLPALCGGDTPVSPYIPLTEGFYISSAAPFRWGFHSRSRPPRDLKLSAAGAGAATAAIGPVVDLAMATAGVEAVVPSLGGAIRRPAGVVGRELVGAARWVGRLRGRRSCEPGGRRGGWPRCGDSGGACAAAPAATVAAAATMTMATVECTEATAAADCDASEADDVALAAAVLMLDVPVNSLHDPTAAPTPRAAAFVAPLAAALETVLYVPPQGGGRLAGGGRRCVYLI